MTYTELGKSSVW